MDLYKNNFEDINPYTFSDYLFAFNPTWREKVDPTKAFERAVGEAKKMLKREIRRASDNIKDIQIVKNIYEKTEDKRTAEPVPSQPAAPAPLTKKEERELRRKQRQEEKDQKKNNQ